MADKQTAKNKKWTNEMKENETDEPTKKNKTIYEQMKRMNFNK